jgi:3-isopropylmalate/(R)-2-methylmalate dehydratase small subunit
MDKFSKLTAAACPINQTNLNTDQILPARYLKWTRAMGIGKVLFQDLRFDAEGKENPDFPINKPAWRNARIVVGARNFGCGSSREAAVWVLAANGFRSVVAPSLGDIFHQNCFKNGLLPVILPAEAVAGLRRQLHERPGTTLTVDLETQTVMAPDGAQHRFEVDAFRKEMLLTGRDEIGLTLGFEAKIVEFEARHAREMAWTVPPRLGT